MSAPDILDFPPERLVDPVARRPLAARLGTAWGDGLLALLLNAAALGWLAQVGWPLRSAEAPAPISVELVDHVPGEGSGQPGAAGEPSAARGPSGPRTSEPDRLTDPAAAATPTSKQVEAHAAKPAEPAPEPVETAEASPEAKPAAETSPRQEPAPSSATQAAPDAVKPAVPPPPEHPDDASQPRLVEAPKAPAHGLAATPNVAPPASPTPAPDSPTAAPQGPLPPHPEVLASPQADEPLPAAAPPPPPTAEQRRQAESTAKLAAVLPFSASVRTDPFQARFGQGQSPVESYRGAVYGNFSKANDLVEDARAKHMRGQAVVAFSIDDGGKLASLAIAVSSGNPEVDQTALELIRRAAPFPPPPPGAQRSFSPAIGFGLDE